MVEVMLCGSRVTVPVLYNEVLVEVSVLYRVVRYCSEGCAMSRCDSLVLVFVSVW